MYSLSLQMFPLLVNIFMLFAHNGLGHPYDMVTSPLDSDKTDTTEALLKEWSLACQKNTGGTISVPRGTFLLKPVTFKGPCNGPITFNVEGTLMAPSDPSIGDEEWIMFDGVDDLTISGQGTFNGQGPFAWKQCKEGSCGTRPTSLKFHNMKNTKIGGITSLNSKYFHMHIHRCEDFYVTSRVRIIAPADSPNTDGIHISNSNNVQIRNVFIATGDDCISLGDGSTNINITRVKCGPGHGFSIGSLGSYPNEMPVKGVTISDSILTGTTNGVRIKTFGSSISGSVSDVTFRNIDIDRVEKPILIDQNYCPHDSCDQKGESKVKISNVKFIDIKGISTSEVSVELDCSGSTPCQGIVLQDLGLSYKNPQVPSKATCSNFNGQFDGNQVPSTCTNV